MSLMDNKTTYGTVPTVKNLGTKGSRRGLVVGLVRPRRLARGKTSFTVRHRRDVCSSQPHRARPRDEAMPTMPSMPQAGGYKSEGY